MTPLKTGFEELPIILILELKSPLKSLITFFPIPEKGAISKLCVDKFKSKG